MDGCQAGREYTPCAGGESRRPLPLWLWGPGTSLSVVALKTLVCSRLADHSERWASYENEAEGNQLPELRALFRPSPHPTKPQPAASVRPSFPWVRVRTAPCLLPELWHPGAQGPGDREGALSKTLLPQPGVKRDEQPGGRRV